MKTTVSSSHIQYASWVNTIKTSVMQKMLIASSKPNFISFALGLGLGLLCISLKANACFSL
jgi:hypothetical protein